MAWLSIQLKVGVVVAESIVSIGFFGVEDNDRDGTSCKRRRLNGLADDDLQVLRRPPTTCREDLHLHTH